MAGPWHRFRAMHRWWIVLACALVLMFVNLGTEGGGALDWPVVVTGAAILWGPLTILMVLVPYLRVPIVLGLFSGVALNTVPLTGSSLDWVILFGLLFVIIVALGRVKVTTAMRSAAVVDRPLHEMEEMTRHRATTAFWNPGIDRIEAHPELPDRWRLFLRPPMSKHIPYYDVEETGPDGDGWQSYSVLPSAQAHWGGSVVQYCMEDTGDGRTRFRQIQHSKLNAMTAIIFWFDRAGQDALEQLKAHAEARPDWTITVSNLAWWPTWRPAPDASVF